MSGARPFRDVKLQWLQQLSCDKDLSDSARSVALYIITTHLNGHTEKAWPSYQTIADATGKSVKTIQRAVGTSTRVANEKADQIANLFPMGRRFSVAGGEIVVMKPADIREGFPQDADWRTPVIVDYEAS